MKRKSQYEPPKTIGELRRRLEKLGKPWEVDPRFSDDDDLPDRPRGGQREEEIPKDQQLAPLKADSDLLGVITAQPPANPFLRVRWAEAGMLKGEEVEGLVTESGEGDDA